MLVVWKHPASHKSMAAPTGFPGLIYLDMQVRWQRLGGRLKKSFAARRSGPGSCAVAAATHAFGWGLCVNSLLRAPSLWHYTAPER
jgi:hypothetical protein